MTMNIKPHLAPIAGNATTPMNGAYGFLITINRRNLNWMEVMRIRHAKAAIPDPSETKSISLPVAMPVMNMMTYTKGVLGGSVEGAITLKISGM